MRTFAAALVQNLGTGALGTVLDLTGHLVDVGGIKFEVDKELTKMAPGDLSLSVEDGDGSIWTWIQTQIQMSGALLPPFLTLDVEMVRVFTGIIKPSEMSRDARTRKIEITAQDWSTMLASKPLTVIDGWARPEPKAISGRAASQTLTGYGSVTLAFGVPCCLTPDSIFFDEPMNAIVPGDIIDGSTNFGTTFTSLKALSVSHNSGPSGSCVVKVSQMVWPPGFGGTVAQYSGTWTRRASATTPQAYYQVTTAVSENPDPAIYKISLDIVDGLTPGDVLELQNADRSATYTVMQIDPIQGVVHVKEEVSNLALNDRLYFSDESAAQMVLEDVRTILSRACAPYAADFSGCTPTTLPSPLLSWLPLRPHSYDDLHSVSDVESNLSTVRVFCGSLAWDGTPETGWVLASGTHTPKASWVDQKLVAPASLMPDDSDSLVPLGWKRNQTPHPGFRNKSRYDDEEDPLWDPDDVQFAANAVVYDYLLMRRVLFSGADASISAWNGTTWGDAVSDTFPEPVQSAVVFPTAPAGSILALCTDGMIHMKVMPSGTAYSPLWIPSAASDGELRVTPWGVYIVSSKGYGKISFVYDSLSLVWVTLSQNDDMRILPNTFCAIDGSVMAFALVNGIAKDGVTVLTETYLLRLAFIPTNNPTAQASILWSESVLDGAAISCGAVRDPSSTGRVVGHVGGRLFQFSSQMGIHYALERFTPSGMMASELIEHVCQIMNLVAYPSPTGTMYFKSRASSGTPTALTVDQVDVIESRAWEHFYSIVRVAGQNDTLYDAYSDTAGGDLLEISSHPMLWSNGSCATMAEVYASWLGIPRQVQKQTWFWTSPDSPAPWEGISPMTRLTINTTGPWLLLALDDDRAAGKATATLLEVT